MVEINRVPVPERYETCITTLEDTKDLTQDNLGIVVDFFAGTWAKKIYEARFFIERAFTASYKTHTRGKNLKNHPLYEH